ncbi:MAG: diguanylate cyclase [Rhizobacter sp.]
MNATPPTPTGRRYAIEWTFYAAALLLVCLLSGYFLLSERARIQVREGERVEVQARVVSANLLQQFIGINNALVGVRNDFFQGDNNQGAAAQSRRLKALTDAVPGLRVMLVLDVHGRVVASNDPVYLGRSFADREYFTAPRLRPDRDLLYISKPFKAGNGAWAMTFTRLLTDAQGRFNGVVMASLSEDYFKVLLTSVLSTPDMRSTLVHGEGIVFMNAPLNPKTLGTDLSGPATFFTRHRRSGRTETLMTGHVQAIGEDRLIATRTITQPEVRMDHPLVIHVSREVGAMYAAWRVESLRLLAVLASFMLGAAVALWLVQRRRREFEALAEQARQEREAAERRIRTVTDNLPAMVAYVDRDQCFRFASAYTKVLMGVPPETVLGRPAFEVLPPDIYAAHRPHIEAVLRGEAQHFERHRHKDGVDVYLTLDYIPDVGADQQVQGFHVMVMDTTALKRVERQLLALARFDSLTGLPNRHQFNEKLSEALARSQRRASPIALMFLDVDHFKSINDNHGHAVGDSVLKEFALRLQTSVRETDCVARLAGDEFVVILEGLHDADEPQQIARKILQQIGRPLVLHALSLKLSTSIGIAFHANGNISPPELLDRADKALYEAKAAGRNTYRIAATPA